MLYLQGCVRCNEGAVYLNSDYYGHYIQCLTCSYLRDVNEIRVNGKREPDMDYVQSLIRTKSKPEEDLMIDPLIKILIDLSRRNQPVEVRGIQESTGLEEKVIEERLRLMEPNVDGNIGYVSVAHIVDDSGRIHTKFGILDGGRYVVEEYIIGVNRVKNPDNGETTEQFDTYSLFNQNYTLTRFGKHAIPQSEILFRFVDHVFNSSDSKKAESAKPL